LAIDNCFASKRWTRPEDWARVIADLGVSYVEASADTELDPLYMGLDYLDGWVKQVRDAQERFGVRVVNLYSGHGTYSTLGLAHTDPTVRKRMRELWFYPMARVAVQLNAGLGFAAHGFPHFVLQDALLYQEYIDILREQLTEIAVYATREGCRSLGVEQMYTPHMIPWTIQGTKRMLEEITLRSGTPFYFTEDVGHHHTKFIAPTRNVVEANYRACNKKDLWLGVDKAYSAFDRGDIDMVMLCIKEHPHLFASDEDGDCYTWLKKLGKYSPIIHLQQTNGSSSKHEPFGDSSQGIINGDEILTSLRKSYHSGDNIKGLPPCECIYLTLELFSATTDLYSDIIDRYRETVNYWRRFVPQDGLRLSEL